MLYKGITAVCSEIHTKHINTLCGQNVELPNVKAGGTVTLYPVPLMNFGVSIFLTYALRYGEKFLNIYAKIFCANCETSAYRTSRIFYRRFRKKKSEKKATWILHVCPSANNNSAPPGRIFVKFDNS